MGLLDFKNKIKKNTKPQIKEQPLQYWEEDSFMIVIPSDTAIDPTENIGEKLGKIKEVKVISIEEPTDENPGFISLEYDGEGFAVGYVYRDFEFPGLMGIQKQQLNEAEISALERANKALTIFMKFHKDSKKSYHLQLKLATAIVPDLAAVMDESAEKLLSARWVNMTATSSVPPGSEAMYSVQAISADNGEVWLHTHGLCRCGITELEIVQSDSENAKNHYEIIKSLAGRLLDRYENEKDEESLFIGLIGDNIPIVVTYVPWTDGIFEYNNLTLGGLADRENGHNSKSSLIFVYKNENDEKKHILSKVNIYDNYWGNNAMFFISTPETERMKTLAHERFGFVKRAAENDEYTIILKLGLDTDQKYREEDTSNSKEHIWFELVGFDGDKFKAKLTQEPYYIDALHAGYIGEYTVNDITDWLICTPSFNVSPETAYLLVQ